MFPQEVTTRLLATYVESGHGEPDSTWCFRAFPSSSPKHIGSGFSAVSTCISLMTNRVEHLDMCSFSIHSSYLVKSVQNFYTLMNWVISLLGFEGFFTYSGHKYFIKCMIWKYLLLICSWPYYPLECFLKIGCSYFWSDLNYLYFYGLYIGITSKSNSNYKIISYFHLEIFEFSIFHLGVGSFWN